MESLLRLSGESITNLLPRFNHKVLLLIKILGLLKEDDNGRTDLGTLEKRLAETQQAQRDSLAPTSGPTSPRSQSSPKDLNDSTPHSQTPHSHIASPEPGPKEPPKQTGNSEKEKRSSTSDEKEKQKQKQPEVEELSDMMCSLVTNNCGETRYIGMDPQVQECCRLY